MCRWLAYSGGKVLLEEVLFKPPDNLIDQSLSARRATTPTRVDAPELGDDPWNVSPNTVQASTAQASN